MEKMDQEFRCPSCAESGMRIFYKMEHLPVHSVVLVQTRKEAMNYPHGDIYLAFCTSCGFIWNIAYQPYLLEASSKYESTQAYSATFNTFARRLAMDLIDRYDIRDKHVLEIGCGQGEFLGLLCELGGNRGTGFDPVYDNQRSQNKISDQVNIIKDFFSDKYEGYPADFVCCKMTLEHIPETADFVSMIRRSVGDRSCTIVFFQVPSVTRILKELAFWDIYYEHCSYFSPGSLARLFRNCDFSVTDLWTDYNDQYLMIGAIPGTGKATFCLPEENDLQEQSQTILDFSTQVRKFQEAWEQRIQTFNQNREKVAIWGSGSKAVSFLSSLKVFHEIEYVVDINPYKQGTYIAGTGQKIVAPEFLKKYKPDILIIMNHVYYKEIQQDLATMRLFPELVTVESENADCIC